MTQPARVPSPGTVACTAPHNDYLTFVLGRQGYAIDLVSVQEIHAFASTIPLGKVPASVTGFLNLRGTLVPIIDLRSKFGLDAAVSPELSVILFLRLARRTIGLVVDKTSGTVTLPPDRIVSPKRFSTSVDPKYVIGLAEHETRRLIVIRADSLISNAEMALIDDAMP